MDDNLNIVLTMIVILALSAVVLGGTIMIVGFLFENIIPRLSQELTLSILTPNR